MPLLHASEFNPNKEIKSPRFFKNPNNRSKLCRRLENRLIIRLRAIRRVLGLRENRALSSLFDESPRNEILPKNVYLKTLIPCRTYVSQRLLKFFSNFNLLKVEIRLLKRNSICKRLGCCLMEMGNSINFKLMKSETSSL